MNKKWNKGAFVASGTRRKSDGSIVSEPKVYVNNEHVELFVPIVLKAICGKAKKKYPQNTALVVDCYLNSLYLAHDWRLLVDAVERELKAIPFSEILLCDGTSGGWRPRCHGHVTDVCFEGH